MTRNLPFSIVPVLLALFVFTAPSQHVAAQEPRQNGDGAPGRMKLGSTNIVDPLQIMRSVRTWTSVEGQKIEGMILSDDGTSVILRLTNGNQATVQRDRLTPQDLAVLDEWKFFAAYFNLNFNAPQSKQARILESKRTNSANIQETPHFQIETTESFPREDFHEIADALEETYANLESLPFAIKVATPREGKLQVKVFLDAALYEKEGGTRDSGATYAYSSRKILLKQGKSNLGALRKHATYALLHHWIYYLPSWMEAGLAGSMALGLKGPGNGMNASEIDERITVMIRSLERKWKDTSECPESVKIPFLQYVDSASLGCPGVPDRASYHLSPVTPIAVKCVFEGMRVMEGIPTTMTFSSFVPGPTSIPVRFVFSDEMSIEFGAAASVCLLGELLRTESPEKLRTFLSAFLVNRLEKDQYVESWKSETDDFRKKVEQQQNRFSDSLEAYAKELEKYNEALLKILREESRAKNALLPLDLYMPDEFQLPVIRFAPPSWTVAPARPEPPVVPAPVLVPANLANPRPDKELSDSEVYRRAYEVILIPKELKAPHRRKR